MLQELLTDKTMQKITLRATEVQTLIHYVASYFTYLPNWLLPSDVSFSQTCLGYSVLACRGAIGLIEVANEHTNGNFSSCLFLKN